MLINFRKTVANLVRVQPEQVDDHDAARRAGQIAAVAIMPDMAFQPRPAAKTQMPCFGGRNNKTGSVQDNAT